MDSLLCVANFPSSTGYAWTFIGRLFATMKRTYGYRQVRYLGLARNDVQLQTMCAAINLRRALVLGLA